MFENVANGFLTPIKSEESVNNTKPTIVKEERRRTKKKNRKRIRKGEEKSRKKKWRKGEVEETFSKFGGRATPNPTFSSMG